MTEIQLPTKATQDAIKQDTTSILSKVNSGSSAVKSVQRGIATISGISSLPITISPVNMNKTSVNLLASVYSASAESSSGYGLRTSGQIRLLLSDSRTLNLVQEEILSGHSARSITVSWEVIEYV